MRFGGLLLGFGKDFDRNIEIRNHPREAGKGGIIGARIGSVVISSVLLFCVLRYRVEKKRRSISRSVSSVNLLLCR